MDDDLENDDPDNDDPDNDDDPESDEPENEDRDPPSEAVTREGKAEAASSDAAIDAWPLCPDCGKLRMTVCPYCGAAGNEFPRADSNFGREEPDPAKGERLAVICSTCDEPWLAEFLRRCEWCGHDFGVGLKYDTPTTDVTPVEFNSRAAFMIFAMGGLLLAIFAWFIYVSR